MPFNELSDRHVTLFILNRNPFFTKKNKKQKQKTKKNTHMTHNKPTSTPEFIQILITTQLYQKIIN